jgi:putative CocE/NonD family hydrolase
MRPLNRGLGAKKECEQMQRYLSMRASLMFATALVTVACAWAAELPPDKYTGWTQDRELFVPMRDGAHLSTTVVLPKGAAGKLPTVLVRTPYDDTSKLFGSSLWLVFYVKHGYAVVLQDERGRGFSEGYYKNFLQNAGADGYDTMDWIVHQPWSNGKVGTIGCSDSADVQWPLAARNHPGHAAMLPAATWAVGNVPDNQTQGTFYRGGVPMLGVDAWAYSYITPSERLLIPPNSTQEQRIRLRNSYSNQFLYAKDFFHLNQSEVLDPSKYFHLPSMNVARALGGAQGPFDDYITWTPADKRWNEVEFIGAGARPRIPALLVTSWHDLGVGETTRLFKYLQDVGTPNQHLIIGAGPHCSYFGEDLSDLKFDDLELGDVRYAGDDHGYQRLFFNWLEYWLKDQTNGVAEIPKVQLYVMGKGWIASDRWPLKETRRTNYYLSDASPQPFRGEAGLLSTTPSRREVADTYVYDPSVPVPSSSGGDSTVALDQRPVEARKDVLTYSTPPLDKPVTVVGPIEVVLYVSSSAKDTDFIVKLLDVYPDGKSIPLNDDAFRVRYRQGFDRKVLMRRGEIYKIALSNMVTAIRFQKGHRIRLDVSSSSFPEYERNLNTGGNNYDETTWVVAENSIHQGSRNPSHIVLSVLPD